MSVLSRYMAIVVISLCLVSFGAYMASETAAAPRLHQAGQDEKEESQQNLPIETDRHLTYTADAVSWMSVDVSPDGQTIVFDLLGNLYTMPMVGGNAVPLTTGMAFDGQPVFSPDGNEVVFTSDLNGGENIWIINLETKKTRPVTKVKTHRYQSPVWTPDGEYIVASRAGLRSGNHKLWMFHKDGGAGVQLIKEPDDLKTIGPAFGPDPRYIWFSKRTRDWQYNAIFPQYQLAVYDRDTGKIYSRSSRFGSAFRPTLSPDGHWLVYGTRHDAQTGLRLRNLQNGEERWLAYPVQRDDQESRATRGVLPNMAFTPDSQEIITSYGGKLWALPVEKGLAREIPFSAEVDLALGPELNFDYPVADAPTFVTRQIRDAVPSPDGLRLAFVAMDRLYVMDYPQGTPKRLTRTNVVEAQPVWSPDGRWIAYVTWDDSGGHVYRVRWDVESEPERLTSTVALYRQPAWSPDGARIVVVRDSAQAFRDYAGSRISNATAELAWIPAEGGKANLIGPTDGRTRPHFTDNSKRIYLYSGVNGLVSIRWDGSDQQEHLKVTGLKLPDAENPIRASTVLISPDGKHALAHVESDLYAVTVPYVGGDAPTVSVADPSKAIFPVRKLTEIGGQFPTWGGNGKLIHWSIGNAHVVYDLEAAKQSEASEEDEVNDIEIEENDIQVRSNGPHYVPEETRIVIYTERDIPKGMVLLRGARVITMRGDEVIEDGDVLIRNNRIEAVGMSGSLDVPSNAEIIDLAGATIVPGFVDTHAHIRPSWEIHRAESWAFLANLAYGVTTTRDPQTSTTDVLTYSDHVEAGNMLGPRVYSTGPGVFWNEQVKDLGHARRIMKRYSDYYDTKTIKMYVAGNRQQRQWILIAAREEELMPTTEGSLDLKLNLTQFIDGYPGHEHSLPIFPLYDDVVKLVAAAQTVYTPTLLVAYGGPWAENYFYTRENPHGDSKLARFTPHDELDRRTRRRGQGTGPGPGGWFMEEEHVFKGLAKFVSDLISEGGRAGVGSHGQLQGLGYHWELWAMQSGGLSNHDALKLATIVGADAIGLDGDLGSIEAGKLADLLILRENPLDNIRHTNTISFVMKGGRLYDGDTLDEQYPRERPAGRFWWQEDIEPSGVSGVRSGGSL